MDPLRPGRQPGPGRMSGALRANRALRAAAVGLVLGGVAFHLWLGARLPLLAVPVGLACHLAAGLAARRWARGRAQAAEAGAAQ
ncbi:hypothetical protein GCM10010440_41100 [Kitasatospora cinereorecta]